tara:strand:+ start:205 stop:963 length:759 start_codon:yes stop_codon:yes gene_type:complete
MEVLFGISWQIAALVGATFFFGGLVKGVIGIALPIVSFGILSTLLPVPVVLGYMVIPLVITNLTQTLQAGNPAKPAKRFWPLILFLVAGILISARLVTDFDPRIIYGIIGVAVVVFSTISLVQPEFRLPRVYEKPAGVFVGALGGFLGGISTIWGPPITMYLVALKLDKDEMIRSTGLIWLCASVPMVLAYIAYDILNEVTWKISAAATLPAVAGFYVGAYVRQFIGQKTFRTAILLFLIVIGLNLLRRAVL